MSEFKKKILWTSYYHVHTPHTSKNVDVDGIGVKVAIMGGHARPYF